MNESKMGRWLEQIFATEPEEISCSVCLDESSQCVEWEVNGKDGGARLKQVKQHLVQCRACREEYETLLELARMESRGDLPNSDQLRKSI